MAAGQPDPRSDLYSLGALGYYLLTGEYVFDGKTVLEIHEQQLTAVPVPPSQRTNNPVSPELEQILLRCLEKDAGARPQSAHELRRLLLACSASAEWTPEARVAWWDAYDNLPVASPDETPADSTPRPNVSIDLDSRME
jgi:serine/threonine-protein kinase